MFLIFLSAAALQLIYYGLAMLRIARHKPYENPLSISDPPVSVVICAHNELKNLKNLIPKLLKQAYTGFEIIVVDDRSDDGSYEYLQEEKNNSSLLKVVRVDFTPDHVQPKKFAITLGVKAAANDLVLFTDADCEPATIHWIRSMATQFDDKIKFVIGFSYFHRSLTVSYDLKRCRPASCISRLPQPVILIWASDETWVTGNHFSFPLKVFEMILRW